MWILLKNFPIEEDQTEQKFLIINLEQVFDQNHFKYEFYKKSSLSNLIEVRNLIFEISDHHGLLGHAVEVTVLINFLIITITKVDFTIKRFPY